MARSLELLAGRSLRGLFQHKRRVQAASYPVESLCGQEFVREKDNRRRFGVTCRFRLLPTLTHCTESIAVALCLLYLRVCSISLNREPL